LAKGETAAAEAVFQGVKERRKAEGAEAFTEAATSARWRSCTTPIRHSTPIARLLNSIRTTPKTGSYSGTC